MAERAQSTTSRWNLDATNLALRTGARVANPQIRLVDGLPESAEWTAIKPMLANKPRGVRRVNDRRVLGGIFWVLRSGAPWRDQPETFGSPTTYYNRFVRRPPVMTRQSS